MSEFELDQLYKEFRDDHIPDQLRALGRRGAQLGVGSFLSVQAFSPGLAAAAETVEVQPDDTLGEIALDEGVTVRDLTVWNDLSNPNLILVGQELFTSDPDEPENYTVESNDTLGEIAQKHGLNLLGLAAVNGIPDPDHIEVGLQLILSDEAGPEEEHIIEPGGTVYAVIEEIFPESATEQQINDLSVVVAEANDLPVIEEPDGGVIVHVEPGDVIDTSVLDVLERIDELEPLLEAEESSGSDVDPPSEPEPEVEAELDTSSLPTPEVSEEPEAAPVQPEAILTAEDLQVMAMAEEILANPNITYMDSPNDRVRRSVEDLRDNGRTFRYDVDQDNIDEVRYDPNLLRLALSAANHLPIRINSLTTSRQHGDTSFHYGDPARALDIDGLDRNTELFGIIYGMRHEIGIDELFHGGPLPEGTSNIDRGREVQISEGTAASHIGYIHVATNRDLIVEEPDINDLTDEELEILEEYIEAIEEAEEAAALPEANQGWILDGLSSNYHQIVSQIPSVEFARNNHDSFRGHDYGPRLSIEDVAIIAYHSGWRDEDLAIAIALGKYVEGGGAPFVINSAAGTYGGDFHPDTIAVGPWQVLFNPNWDEAIRDPQANLDPLHNGSNAYQLWTRQGWEGWEAFTRGMHLPHMEEARAVAQELAAQGWY